MTDSTNTASPNIPGQAQSDVSKISDSTNTEHTTKHALTQNENPESSSPVKAELLKKRTLSETEGLKMSSPVETQSLKKEPPKMPSPTKTQSQMKELPKKPSPKKPSPKKPSPKKPSPKKSLPVQVNEPNKPTSTQTESVSAKRRLKKEAKKKAKKEANLEDDDCIMQGIPPIVKGGNQSTSDSQTETFGNLEKVRSSTAQRTVGKGVEIGLKALDNLHTLLTVVAKDGNDAARWNTRLASINRKLKDTRTVVGILGSTGAGKSSLINAVLDEESLIPTNCMRACTAVPTEIRFNHDDSPNHAYRGEAEFITAEDWAKEISILLAELVDPGKKLSKDYLQPDTGAGIAYAKIRAVYPHLTDNRLVKCTVKELLEDRAVKDVLGTVKVHKRSNADALKADLQVYVDSVEKPGNEARDKKIMAYWPLVKLVRIFLKAKVLSTGTVLVDLPGVQDSNAARSAVAEGFRTECSSIWIVSPINRAVDDKAAKHLLGTSFKLQLTMDGTYSNVTFICSKTDDISVKEVSEKLDGDGKIQSMWVKEEECHRKMAQLKREMERLSDEREDLEEVIEELEAGRPKKRKFAHLEPSSTQTHEQSAHPDGSEASDGDIEKQSVQVRRDLVRIRRQLKQSKADLAILEDECIKLKLEATARCVEARNDYSTGAIRTDFADGVRETFEDAEMEAGGGTQPVPEPNYDLIAKSLPVFCVSSRAYQSLKGRSRKDGTIPGYRSVADTQIPQLQEHTMRLADLDLDITNKEFLGDVGRTMRSMLLWVSNDLSGGSGLSHTLLSEEELSKMDRLDSIVAKLRDELGCAVKTAVAGTRSRVKNELLDPIWPMCGQVADQLVLVASGWAERGNAVGNPLRFSTFRSILNNGGTGVTRVSKGLDFNDDLIIPLKKKMAIHWDATFGKTFNAGAGEFTSAAKEAMETFHQRMLDCPGLDLSSSGNLGLLNEQMNSQVRLLRLNEAKFKTALKLVQRTGGRTFAKYVGTYMKETYTRCAAIHGSGCFKLMKAALEDYIADNCQEILVKAVEGVECKLDHICISFEQQMQQHADHLLGKIKEDYERAILGRERVLTGGGDASPSLRVVQAQVHEMLLNVDAQFEEALRLDRTRSKTP